MILVTGGAYAGKTDFAREHFPGMKLEVRYHETVRRHLEDGTDPLEAAAALAAGKDVVVLLDEVGCGIVPMEASERAYREIMGVILEHEVNFKPDVNTARWGRMGSSYVEINKTVLVRELQNIGFNFDAVKKQWAKQGYLLKNACGRYAICTKVDGEKGYYVCLKYDPAA